MTNDGKMNDQRVLEARQRGPHVSPLGRLGFVIVAMFACTASNCPFVGGDDDDPVAANPPAPPSPPQSPPQSPPAETCWEAGIDIDPVIGCHRVSVDIKAGDPEIYEAILTYPEFFQFNGFDVVGAPGTVLGSLSLSSAFGGRAERTVPFLSLDSRAAYADVFSDGRFSPAFEPLLAHVHGGEFRLHLPFGGDANVDTQTVLMAARLTLRVREELMTARSPVSTGFTVSGRITSVDPDTGGRDDGQGVPPTVSQFTADVEIVE